MALIFGSLDLGILEKGFIIQAKSFHVKIDISYRALTEWCFTEWVRLTL